MVQRRDEIADDGRWLAGPDGDLFLQGDGTTTVFDPEPGETYPDRETAAHAWERCRVRTWRHPDREDSFPPVAAAVYDGVGSRAAHIGPRSLDAAEVLAAIEADLATVETFRRDRPDAAESIAAELDAYVHLLELLAGLVSPYLDMPVPGSAAARIAASPDTDSDAESDDESACAAGVRRFSPWHSEWWRIIDQAAKALPAAVDRARTNGSPVPRLGSR